MKMKTPLSLITLFIIFFVYCNEPASVEEVNDTTTPTAEKVLDEDPDLYVMLMWHQHQPFWLMR